MAQSKRELAFQRDRLNNFLRSRCYNNPVEPRQLYELAQHDGVLLSGESLKQFISRVIRLAASQVRGEDLTVRVGLVDVRTTPYQERTKKSSSISA